jgi:hypothetical protein
LRRGRRHHQYRPRHERHAPTLPRAPRHDARILVPQRPRSRTDAGCVRPGSPFSALVRSMDGPAHVTIALAVGMDSVVLSPARNSAVTPARLVLCAIQHLRGRSATARSDPLRSAAVPTAEATPLCGSAGELTNVTERLAPREAQRPDLRLETVDSDPALIPAVSSTHWSAGEAARMSPCPMTSRMAAASRK